jgi:hypothetical protein
MSVNWPYLPQNINSIDNTLIEQVAQKYKNFNQLLILNKIKIVNSEEYNKLIQTNDSIDDDSSAYTHLMPPYTLPCEHNTEGDTGCLKKSAFKNNNTNKNYCWFHINYSTN